MQASKSNVAGSIAAAASAFAVTIVFSADALAYIGPGAGLSLLGVFWALFAAVGTAIMFLATWPIRRFPKQRRRARAAASRKPPVDPAGDEFAPAAAEEKAPATSRRTRVG